MRTERKIQEAIIPVALIVRLMKIIINLTTSEEPKMRRQINLVQDLYRRKKLLATEFLVSFKGYEQEIEDLVTSLFTASEGAEEGALIGTLSRNLINQTPEGDLRVHIARIDKTIVGAIFFSRLFFDMDDRVAFVLGPVVVATEHQRQGIGKRLLLFGLTKPAMPWFFIRMTSAGARSSANTITPRKSCNGPAWCSSRMARMRSRRRSVCIRR